ncbi:hypothetical protein PM082_015217 [Marasmius tenuissimus]|nr:hypothetical protein PM082_015217 [Marasmius tenuissimus]
MPPGPEDIFLIWDLSISKLYSISLVVSLNARRVKDRYEETRPALFIDDSTMGTTIATTGIGKGGFDPFPWVHPSPMYPAPAMRTLTTATHHPERNLSVSTVSTTSSSTTKSTIRTIYPDETGRYVVGYNVPRKAPPTFDHEFEQPLQPLRLKN